MLETLLRSRKGGREVYLGTRGAHTCSKWLPNCHLNFISLASHFNPCHSTNFPGRGHHPIWWELIWEEKMERWEGGSWQEGKSGRSTREDSEPGSHALLLPLNALPGACPGWWPVVSSSNRYFCQLLCVNMANHSLIKLMPSLNLFCWGADFSARGP